MGSLLPIIVNGVKGRVFSVWPEINGASTGFFYAIIVELQPYLYHSGQIIIFHKPRFP